jgi:hypothetical protein
LDNANTQITDINILPSQQSLETYTTSVPGWVVGNVDIAVDERQITLLSFFEHSDLILKVTKVADDRVTATVVSPLRRKGELVHFNDRGYVTDQIEAYNS